MAYFDLDGTSKGIFEIGHRLLSGTKNLLFTNTAGTGTLSWNPTANRTLTAPDVTGQLATEILGRDDKSADYTFALTDRNRLIALTGSTARTFTIPLNASVAFPAGSIIHLVQDGTGILSIAPVGAGVTLRSAGNRRRSAEQYSPLTLLRDPATTDLWYLFGDLIT